MKPKPLTPAQQKALTVECPFCFAPPGEACHRHIGKNGNDLPRPHVQRVAKVT